MLKTFEQAIIHLTLFGVQLSIWEQEGTQENGSSDLVFRNTIAVLFGLAIRTDFYQTEVLNLIHSNGEQH